jgi:hypothetical protein
VHNASRASKCAGSQSKNSYGGRVPGVVCDSEFTCDPENIICHIL